MCVSVTMVAGTARGQDKSGWSFPDFSLPDLSLPDWVPPVQTFGNVGYTFQTGKSGDDTRTFRNLVNATVVGNSYIYQPWLAAVSGSMTVSETFQSSGEQSTSNGIVTGNLGVNLLPISDFPTTINYSRTDTSVTAEDFESSTVTDAFQLASRVKWDQTLTVLTNLDYSDEKQTDAADQTFVGATLNVTKNFDEQHLNVIFDVSNRAKSRSLTDGATDQATYRASLRHRFSPWDNVNYDSTSSILLNTDSSTTRETEQLTSQASSTLRWTPKDSPLSAAAVWTVLSDDETTNFVNAATTSGETRKKRKSFDGRIGAFYDISDTLKLDASLDGALRTQSTESTIATDSSSNSDRNPPTLVTAGGSAGLTYLQDPIPVQGFNWTLNASARSNVSGGTGSSAERTVEGVVGHAFYRTFATPIVGSVDFNLSESLDLTHTNVDETVPVVPAVSHSLTLGHQEQEGNQYTIVNLTLSDSRTFLGTDRSDSQLANLQISKGLATSEKSSWTTNLSVQATRQGGEDSSSDGITTSSQGSVVYQLRDMFGVRNLNFESRVNLTSNQLVPVALSTVSPQEEDALSWNREWITSVIYRIGQLTIEGKFRLDQDQSREVTDFFELRMFRNF
ncbi:MAG: hypothetical protein COW30_08465 [Rhodospirillales bacterium CG15_BIG_FIL_POST_REV_8_21_14_020_66_15]|nr:MAG: hypothetical protein COW30_08465 [Rhodospirillales bacterium CG15_BIG_FIL_POST_REV_8_21_14_020_66_15]